MPMSTSSDHAFQDIRDGVRDLCRQFPDEYHRQVEARAAALIPQDQVAPISTNLILSYVAEHVLGLPRSF